MRRLIRFAIAWKLAALLVLVGGCGLLATPTGDRPLTLKEAVFQAGGLLEGVLEEIAAAKAAGTLTGANLAKVTASAQTAFKVYQTAKQAAITGDQIKAETGRLELIRLINTLRQDLAKALGVGT